MCLKVIEPFRKWPDELVEEILSWLPVKHVLRCRAVCKIFNRLTSTDRFKKCQLVKMKFLNQTGYLIERGRPYSPIRYETVFDKDKPVLRRIFVVGDAQDEVIASCYSLVATCNRRDELGLWNPSIKAYSTIGNPQAEISAFGGFADVVYGLGYVDSRDDYLLFRLSTDLPQGIQTQLMVYSRNNRKWSLLPDFPYSLQRLRAGVYVCGSLHWLIDGSDGEPSICALNVEEISYSVIELNYSMCRKDRCYHIGSLDDKTLVVYTAFCRPFGINYLWLLMDYYDMSSWRKINIQLEYPLNLGNQVITIQPMAFFSCRKQFSFRVDPIGLYGIYNIVEEGYALRDGRRYIHNCSVILNKVIESFELPTMGFQVLN